MCTCISTYIEDLLHVCMPLQLVVCVHIHVDDSGIIIWSRGSVFGADLDQWQCGILTG